MSKRDRYYIDIFGLKNGTHQFDFIIDDNFFQAHENSFSDKGKGVANVTLEKTENHVNVTLDIDVNVMLTCDRSLENFEFPIKIEKSVIFKYGEEEQELDVDLFMIEHEAQRLNLGQHIFDYIGLSIPYKKLHPRFEVDEEKDQDELIFQTPVAEEDEKEIDPRWAALKKFKK
ncbi:MAG: YceD family protein [Candidatus Cyclobacteriaceae bacterium M2_1C_046]